MACPAITVDKNYFLIKDVLGRDPEDVSKFCLGLQQEWKTFFSTEAMRDFAKSKIIHLVWVSNKFGDTLPDDLSEADTYQLLSGIYDERSVQETGNLLRLKMLNMIGKVFDSLNSI